MRTPSSLPVVASMTLVLAAGALADPASAAGRRAARDRQGGASAAPAAPEVTAAPSGPIAARVNGREVPQADLDRALGAKLIELLQAQYYARLNALPSVVAEQLLAEEAGRRGIAVEELLRQEVDSKVVAPDENEIMALRSLMKDQLPEDPDLARAAVVQGLLQQRRGMRLQQLQKDLFDEATVQILMEPPRIQLPPAPHAPSKGPDDAPITIFEFADFQCTQCATLQATLAGLQAAHPGQIRVVFRHLPLSIHDHALEAASLSACAADQGKFWELHDWMFANQGKLAEDDVLAAAPSLGIDAETLRTCQLARAHAPEIEADMAMARALGVNTTPFVLVNGRPLVGSAALQQVTAIVEDELARAKRSGDARQQAAMPRDEPVRRLHQR